MAVLREQRLLPRAAFCLSTESVKEAKAKSFKMSGGKKMKKK